MVIEQRQEDALFEHGPDLEASAAVEFGVHIEECTRNDGLSPDKFALGVGAVEVDRQLGFADGVEGDHFAFGMASVTSALAEEGQGEPIEGIDEETAEVTAAGVGMAQEAIDEDFLVEETLEQIVGFVGVEEELGDQVRQEWATISIKHPIERGVAFGIFRVGCRQDFDPIGVGEWRIWAREIHDTAELLALPSI